MRNDKFTYVRYGIPSLECLLEWGIRGKKSVSQSVSQSVFDFLTYSRETGFLFSYAEGKCLDRPSEPSNKIDRVSKFDNSLLFGTKQNALRQLFFAL